MAEYSSGGILAGEGDVLMRFDPLRPGLDKGSLI